MSKSTLNESILNISQEKDHRIVDLEAALDATQADFDQQLHAVQAVFKKKLIAIKQFPLPYDLSDEDLSTGRNEHFSKDLVKFTKEKLAEGFKQHVTLTEVTSFVR